MPKSMLMKLFTLTIIPLIIGPVLTYAAPNSNPNLDSTLSKKVERSGGSNPSEPAAIPIPGNAQTSLRFANDLKDVQGVWHEYSVALDNHKLENLDVLCDPYARFYIHPTIKPLDLTAFKTLLRTNANKSCHKLRKFHIDNVMYYQPPTSRQTGLIYTSGHFSLHVKCGDNIGESATVHPTFTDTLVFPMFNASNTSGNQRWQFLERDSSNGYW